MPVHGPARRKAISSPTGCPPPFVFSRERQSITLKRERGRFIVAGSPRNLMIDEPFIRSIGILVIAAAVFALGARALSSPTIVAYLAAGLLLGPLTGIIEVSEAIHLIAETGIVLLLFLVGLELSFEKIRGVGFVAIVAGGAQIALTILGGFALCFVLGFTVVPALIIAVALTFSSTVIVVKILVDNRDTNKPFGQIAIGILLVQDLFVVILLTLISGLAGGDGDSFAFAAVAGGLARAFGEMALLLAAVLGASKWMLPRPFTWAARSPETLLIWSLCWCFLIVAATHILHLSQDIGAFVAGISLAQLPYHRDLQRRVQPLMNFFIAVFFVSLGIEMPVDVSLVFWAKAAALAAFVLVGKFVIIMYIVARLAYAEKTAYFAALLLTQVSEFSFIFIALAVDTAFIDATATALIGLVGLFSITISTVAFVIRERLYRTVRNLGLLRMFGAREEENEKEEHGGPEEAAELGNHVIVVGINALGRELARRLRDAGEEVLAIDIDPGKLKGVSVRTLLGDAESAALLQEAELAKAKLLISTLHIEPTNDLLAFRCRQAGVPCSIHAVDLTALDNLLEMNVKYLIVPKADGMKRQNEEIERLGFFKK